MCFVICKNCQEKFTVRTPEEIFAVNCGCSDPNFRLGTPNPEATGLKRRTTMELKPLSKTLVNRIREHLEESLEEPGGGWNRGADYESLDFLDMVLEESTGRGV